MQIQYLLQFIMFYIYPISPIAIFKLYSLMFKLLVEVHYFPIKDDGS